MIPSKDEIEPGHGSILVVDDEASVCEFLSELFTGWGHEVETRRSGEAAVKALKERSFDIALTDLRMPGMDGVATVEALKALDPDLEVIVATGNASVETAIACMRRGAFDYITKPFNLAELQLLLERALEKGRLQSHGALYATSQALIASLDRPGLAQVVLDSIPRVVRVDGAGVVLAGAELVFASSSTGTPPGEAFLRQLLPLALAARGPLRVTRLEPESLARGGADARWSEGLVYPLVAHGVPLGVLALLRQGEPASPIAGAEARRAQLYAAQATMALDNARLYAELGAHAHGLQAAHAEISATEARTRAVLESAHDGIVSFDAGGTIHDANGAATALFGWGREGAAGRNFFALFEPAADRERLRAVLASQSAGVAASSTGPIETTALTAAGESFPAEVCLGGSQAPGGQLYSGFVRDLREKKRLEVELRHAQRLESVGRLAAGIAHEINTPTQFVGDNVHFLEDAFQGVRSVLEAQRAVCAEAEHGQPAAATLAAARAAAEEADIDYLVTEIPKAIGQTLEGIGRIATIVKAMKEFAHPDTREKASADINRALQCTLTVARNELKYVADVETELGDLPPVVCHLGDLNQVFLNLFVNAAHAIGDVVRGSGAKGRIRVATRRDGDDVVISVEDSGCGIPAEIRGKVFDPFFTTKEVGRGTGQGLALARSIVVDKHGGSLSFESTVGKGTTFHVRLPIDSAGTREVCA